MSPYLIVVTAAAALLLVAIIGAVVVGVGDAWRHMTRHPKRHIKVSPLLMVPSTNKYDVMQRMRKVAEQHRNKDVVIFPEDDDAQSP